MRLLLPRLLSGDVVGLQVLPLGRDRLEQQPRVALEEEGDEAGKPCGWVWVLVRVVAGQWGSFTTNGSPDKQTGLRKTRKRTYIP